MLDDILFLPLYPTSFRNDIPDRQQREAALQSWTYFVDSFELYSLLGDLWANRDVDYAMKCFKIVEKNESRNPSEPPTVAEFVCGYKLGSLYRRKGDIASAIREFNKVLTLSSNPKMSTLDDYERALGAYWVNKANKELAEIQR